MAQIITHTRRLFVGLVALLSLSPALFAQEVAAETETSPLDTRLADAALADYQLVRLDAAAIRASLDARGAVDIRLPDGRSLAVRMSATEQLAPSYTLTTMGKRGNTAQRGTSISTYQGPRVNGFGASLTVSDNWLQGQLPQADAVWYIEPAQHLVPGAPVGTYLLYKVSDVIVDTEAKCGRTSSSEKGAELMERQLNSPGAVQAGGQCLNIRLAIASDFAMFNTYGSVAATEAFIVSVVNDMETDYQSAFQEAVDFTIVEQVVSTSANTPLETALTNSTASEVLLANFSAWARSGSGFASGFDLAQLWVERNITSDDNNGFPQTGTVGVAYTPGICRDGTRFAVFENFSATAWLLRVLASHETGHNFSLTHDAPGSPTIMAPSINNTTAWSAQSVAQFENHMRQPACLNGPLALSGSPKLVFAAPAQLCAGQVARIDNRSGRMPGIYIWTFPGGTPPNSMATNPTVSFATPGTQTLSVSSSNGACGVGVTVTETRQVTVINEAAPAAACVPNAQNTATTGNFGIGIRRFAAGTIANVTGDAGQTGLAYNDYACQFFDGAAANSIAISIDILNANSQTVEVYVDLNNDGGFTANEELFSQTVAGVGFQTAQVTTLNGTLAIPATAVRDQILRMRVLCVGTNNANAVNGCANSNFQEVEDYGLRFATAVPVEIVEFSAAEQGSTVTLAWSVAQERDLAGYRVEHSTDAEDWAALGTVAAAARPDYSYEHPGVRPGVHYYRLASVDLDGATELTDPIALRVQSLGASLSVYPNPVRGGEANVALIGWGGGRALEVRVFDLQGRQVAFAKTPADVNGNADLALDFDGLPAGMYLVRANDGEVERQQLVGR